MSTTVSEVKSQSLFFGNVNNTGKSQEMQGKDSFSEVFDKTQTTSENGEKEAIVKIDDAETIQNHANVQKKTSEPIKEKDGSIKEIKEENVEDKMLESANEMAEKMAETFGVTVEDVEKALEELGLTLVDLLNSENLTKVVLVLNPECDALSLMTNEELFADLKGLMNAAQELKDQIAQNFNLTEEEMAAVLNSVKEKAQAVIPTEAVIPETPQLSETVAEKQPATLTVDVNVTETVLTEEETVKAEVRTEVKTAELPENAYEGTVIPKTESSQNARNSASDAGDNTNSFAGQQFNQNLVNQLADAVENAKGTHATSYGVSGQDIINQITEHIRVNVKQDTTEMELQLHPASLGNVKVQLTSAGGVLTAVFTTENEAVKAALESQLIQLKDNFAEQGLKVESVEVNVSAQGFERSLDQQEQEQNRFESNRSRRSNRRIRLEGAEDAEDILAEGISAEDKIVADMMIRNGNTVDYMV